MKKNILTFIAKFSIVFGLLYWLFSSGKLDLNLLKVAMSNPLKVILVVFLLLATHGIAAYRWRIILQHKSSNKITLKQVFRANWIGIFFSTVLPGSVSGDFVKIFYLNEKSLKKKFLLGSILFDRVIGLFGLICIGAFFSLYNYSSLAILSADIKKVMFTNFLLFFGVCLFAILLFKFKELPGKQYIKITFLKNIFIKIENIWNRLTVFKEHFFKLLFISIFIHFCAIIIFSYIVIPFTNIDVEITTLLSVVPIGLISLAIPIAPAGLGVGHAVFDKLFSFINIDNGANLFNLYFFMVIIANLTGIIPYLFNKRPKLESQEENP